MDSSVQRTHFSISVDIYTTNDSGTFLKELKKPQAEAGTRAGAEGHTTSTQK